MTIVEVTELSSGLTFRQRWSHYFVLIFGVTGCIIGLNLRNTTLNTTATYTNPRAGITADYPQRWLLDEESEGYIFRIRDMSARGFKTTIQVGARAVSAVTTSRNIFDTLTLERAQTRAAYNVIAKDVLILPDETQTQAMWYTFVSTEINPFLQNIPVVVEGIDILIIERGQAIVVTFLSDVRTFDQNWPTLERFLRNMEF